MRFATLALAFLGVGGLVLAAATQPAPTTQPERAATSVTTGAPTALAEPSPSASQPAAPKAVAPAPAEPSPSASQPAAPKAVAPALSAQEQHLISQGYKPQMRNGEKVYCRREAQLGSRISAGQHCGTVAQLTTATQDGKDYTENAQRTDLNPMIR